MIKILNNKDQIVYKDKTKKSIKDIDLRAEHLRNPILKNLQLTALRCENASFHEACVENTNLSESCINMSWWVDSWLLRVHMVRADARFCRMDACVLMNVCFIKAHMAFATFASCTIAHCDFSMANLHGVSFIMMNEEQKLEFLQTCDFTGADLTNCTVNDIPLKDLLT